MFRFTINDAQRNYPERKHVSPLKDAELSSLSEDGFLMKSNLFSHEEIRDFQNATDDLVIAERDLSDPMYQDHKGSVYLRWLLTKDRRFHAFNQNQDIINIARQLLGPQVQIDDADARVSFAGAIDGIGWHIHLRTIPDPLPAFFCYPHALHYLLYLDDISENEGGLSVLPQSHQKPDLKIPADCYDHMPDQITLFPKAGDVIFLHANLWHRAEFSTANSRKRRLLLSTLSPVWLRNDYQVGTFGDINWREEYRQRAQNEEDLELLGDFSWC